MAFSYHRQPNSARMDQDISRFVMPKTTLLQMTHGSMPIMTKQVIRYFLYMKFVSILAAGLLNIFEASETISNILVPSFS